jgi:serine O-acetyltransferase
MRPLEALKADAYRLHGRRCGWKDVAMGALTRRTFRVIVTLRLCQHVDGRSGPIRAVVPLLKLFHRMAARRAGIDLSWRTNIGPGVAFTHGWGMVVNSGATVGSNVTLFHGATLGQRDRISQAGERTTDYPVVEDEVWIGPHAIVVGGVTIGRGSRIAGGAFVTENVPAYSVVSGNPAVIVKSNCVPDVMNPVPLPASEPAKAR